jgi:hypothetical protein
MKAWSDDTLSNDVPIVDATKGIEFMVRPRDIKGAVVRDPENCVAARGIKRVLNGNVRAVKIGAHTARIHRGSFIERYIISRETKALIKAYDAAGFYPSGVVVKLLAPTASTKWGVKPGNRSGKKSKGGTNIRSAKTPWLRHIEQSSSVVN